MKKMSNLAGIIISFLFIALIIASAKVFEKSGNEATRKYIHIMLSNWWIIAMVFFNNVWCVAILPAIFIIVNYISYKNNIIKLMERAEGEENKESLGTVYYAISLLVLTLVTFGPLENPMIGLCGTIVMGYGDGLAAVFGQTFKSKEFKINGSKKTLIGSAVMFVITLIIMAGFFKYMTTDFWYLKSILVAVLITVVEAFSPKGTDNLTVPLGTSLLAFLLL